MSSYGFSDGATPETALNTADIPAAAVSLYVGSVTWLGCVLVLVLLVFVLYCTYRVTKACSKLVDIRITMPSITVNMDTTRHIHDIVRDSREWVRKSVEHHGAQALGFVRTRVQNIERARASSESESVFVSSQNTFPKSCQKISGNPVPKNHDRRFVPTERVIVTHKASSPGLGSDDTPFSGTDNPMSLSQWYDSDTSESNRNTLLEPSYLQEGPTQFSEKRYSPDDQSRCRMVAPAGCTEESSYKRQSSSPVNDIGVSGVAAAPPPTVSPKDTMAKPIVEHMFLDDDTAPDKNIALNPFKTTADISTVKPPLVSCALPKGQLEGVLCETPLDSTPESPEVVDTNKSIQLDTISPKGTVLAAFAPQNVGFSPVLPRTGSEQHFESHDIGHVVPNLHFHGPRAVAPPEDMCETQLKMPVTNDTVLEPVPSKSPAEQLKEAQCIYDAHNSRQVALHANLIRARERLDPKPTKHVQIVHRVPRSRSADCACRRRTSSQTRALSVLSSDVCQISSPPSEPSHASSSGIVRQGPTHVGTTQEPLSSNEGVPGAARRITGYTQAAPIIPLSPPIAYKLELGARIPVYATNEPVTYGEPQG